MPVLLFTLGGVSFFCGVVLLGVRVTGDRAGEGGSAPWSREYRAELLLLLGALSVILGGASSSVGPVEGSADDRPDRVVELLERGLWPQGEREELLATVRSLAGPAAPSPDTDASDPIAGLLERGLWSPDQRARVLERLESLSEALEPPDVETGGVRSIDQGKVSVRLPGLLLAILAVLGLLAIGAGVLVLFAEERRLEGVRKASPLLTLGTLLGLGSLVGISVDKVELFSFTLPEELVLTLKTETSARGVAEALSEIVGPFPEARACPEPLGGPGGGGEAVPGAKLPKLVESYERARRLLEENGGDAVLGLIVGSADKRDLLPDARRRYGSNEGLARARAECVKNRLLEDLRGSGATVPMLLALSTGPAGTGSLVEDDDLARDRAVAVYLLLERSEPPLGSD